MNSQLIGTAVLDIEGPMRKETTEQKHELYLSIHQFGLLHPLTVAQNPCIYGRYTVLAGRRRLAACKRLGMEQVECVVLDWDDLRNKMVEITENFHRLELTPAERVEQMQEYAQLFRLLHPEVEGAAQRARETGDAENRAPRKERPRKSGRQRPQGDITNGIASTLGVGTRTAQLIKRRASVLTKEQLEKLKAASATGKQMDAIIDIKHEGERAEVVDLIGEGRSFWDAMVQVKGEEFAIAEDLETDEEFVARLRLSDEKKYPNVVQAKFRAEALLYRRVRRARIAFERAIGWEGLKDSPEVKGPYFRRLAFFLNCPHPEKWLECHGCDRGYQDDKWHDQCRGGGYLFG